MDAMDELKALYQEVILDHGKSPRNWRKLENHTHKAMGDNPLCGDQLIVFLIVDKDEVISDITFIGQGCAISVASASIMTECLKDKTVSQAKSLFEAVHNMCTGETEVALDEDLTENFERLAVLSGIRNFPTRVKCATLAWHTMQAAVKGEETVDIADI